MENTTNSFKSKRIFKLKLNEFYKDIYFSFDNLEELRKNSVGFLFQDLMCAKLKLRLHLHMRKSK